MTIAHILEEYIHCLRLMNADTECVRVQYLYNSYTEFRVGKLLAGREEE